VTRLRRIEGRHSEADQDTTADRQGPSASHPRKSYTALFEHSSSRSNQTKLAGLAINRRLAIHKGPIESIIE